MLDAVEQCFARFGVDKTTLADVAAACGISRQTVYRYFKDRDALFRGLVMRTIERDWAEVGARFAHCERLQDWLEETTAHALRAFPSQRSHQLMKQLNAYDSGMTIALSDEGLAPAALAMRAQYERSQAAGELRPGLTPLLLAEWLYRLIYSYMLLPSPRLRDEAAQRQWMREVALSGLFITQ